MSSPSVCEGEKDVIDRHVPEDGEPGSLELGKQTTRDSVKRVASHALSRVASRLTTRDIVDPGPPPDGGLKAWTQVAMGWIACFCTWGFINSFGVFQTYYTEHSGESQSTISWVGSLQLYVLFFVSTFSGRALDAGLFIPTFMIGATLQVLGIFMTSLCTSFWQLVLAQGLCTGLGSGMFFCPTLGLVTTYFHKNRGVAVAIFTTGNSAGGAIYPVIVRQLLPKIGFPWTVRVLAFVNLAMLGTALAFLRPRLPPRKAGPIVEWNAFREVPYVCVVFGLTLVFGGLYFATYYLASFGTEIIGMSYSDSLTLIVIYNAAGIPVRLLTGWFADRFLGPLNAMVPLLLLNGILAFAWIAVRSPTDMYIWTTFFGFASGAYQCLFPTTISSLNRDLSKNGTRLGMALSIFSFGGISGPPIGGAILSTHGGGRAGFRQAQLGMGIATMLGVMFVAAGRLYKTSGKAMVKC